MCSSDLAAADFETALQRDANLYIALWLHLARIHGGLDDADELLERETRRIRGGWPSPVVALYLGRTDAASIYASTKTGDAARQADMRCEANFYIAHAHLFKRERATAQTLLQNAQRECAKNLLEYEGAVAELRRLK